MKYITEPYDSAFPVPENGLMGLSKLEEFASRNMAYMMHNGVISDLHLSNMAELSVKAAKALINALNADK